MYGEKVRFSCSFPEKDASYMYVSVHVSVNEKWLPTRGVNLVRNTSCLMSCCSTA